MRLDFPNSSPRCQGVITPNDVCFFHFTIYAPADSRFFLHKKRKKPWMLLQIILSGVMTQSGLCKCPTKHLQQVPFACFPATGTTHGPFPVEVEPFKQRNKKMKRSEEWKAQWWWALTPPRYACIKVAISEELHRAKARGRKRELLTSLKFLLHTSLDSLNQLWIIFSQVSESRHLCFSPQCLNLFI